MRIVRELTTNSGSRKKFKKTDLIYELFRNEIWVSTHRIIEGWQLKHINKNLIKRVHGKIINKGRKVSDKNHFLAGLYAHVDADDFMIAVSDAYNFVKLDFNEEFQFEYVSKDSDEAFHRKIRALDHRY
ncbi:MAG: DUF3081 family protein [Neptuniibacter sp.]